MSDTWPVPEGGYQRLREIAEPLTDEEIRELGYEPTRKGWYRLPRDNRP